MCFPQIMEPVERNFCLCGPVEVKDGKFKPLELTEKPIEYCDKATAFPPKDWERLENYLDEMESWVKANCR